MKLCTRALQPLLKMMFRPYVGYIMEPSSKVEPVALQSADGTPLEGALMHADSDVQGVVVFCHPLLRYGYRYFLRSGLARWAAEEGFHCVLFNFQGIGRSDMGALCFADDVVGVVGYARERFPGLPVHLVGLSFGGYHAAHALVRLDGIVTSAVLDSVPPRIGNFFRTGVSAWVMKALSWSPLAGATGTKAVAASLSRVRRTPILLVYGNEDEYCPKEDVTRLAAAIPAARLKTLDDVGHMDGFVIRRDTYTNALLSLWATVARTEVGV
jgi:pimeloyl-ACP methyl ester carboxylesterase